MHKSIRQYIYILSITLVLLFQPCNVLFSQEIGVPLDIQMQIFIKSFNFDRNLARKVLDTKDLKISILYQSRFRTSSLAIDEIMKTVNQKQLSKFLDNKITYSYVNVNNINDVERHFRENLPNVVIIAPIRAIDIAKVTELTKKFKILSVTLTKDYLRYGVTMGLDMVGDNPQILINLNSSKAEGAEFSSQLLKLSKIIE